MNYTIEKDYRDNSELRHSFDELANEAFGIGFEQFYQNGFWTEKYNPYSIVIDGSVISNVSVNLIDCEINGQSRQYIQLGTVMTKKPYRNKGYCRILMEEILKEYALCDGFFLFANDSVLDFYPKFGFQKVKEYRFCANRVEGSQTDAQAVPMTTRQDWMRFLEAKKQRRSNGIVQLDTDGLLMFYLTQFMQNDVYYIKVLDAYVIAEKNNDTLLLHDVFSKTPVEMSAVCNSFGEAVKKVEFAFAPHQNQGLKRFEYKIADTTFFVRGNHLLQEMNTIFSFPEIAHA